MTPTGTRPPPCPATGTPRGSPPARVPLLTTTSSSYQTSYTYDSLGELVTQTAPATTWAGSGQVTTTTYDPAGNVLSVENPDGVTATNTYTPLDQVSGTSYSDSTHSVSYTYDADGNRTAMTDASGTSSYSYDPFGELDLHRERRKQDRVLQPTTRSVTRPRSPIRWAAGRPGLQPTPSPTATTRRPSSPR